MGEHGQLGTGENPQKQLTPVSVVFGEDVIQIKDIFAGGYCSFFKVLTRDGSWNRYGQLGVAD